jgi:hypothetical protein
MKNFICKLKLIYAILTNKGVIANVSIAKPTETYKMIFAKLNSFKDTLYMYNVNHINESNRELFHISCYSEQYINSYHQAVNMYFNSSITGTSDFMIGTVNASGFIPLYDEKWPHEEIKPIKNKNLKSIQFINL